MIYSFSSPLVGAAPQHGHLRTLLGVPDLTVGKTYFVETPQEVDQATLEHIATQLVSTLDDPYTVNQPFPETGVGVAFKLGVVDNEAQSIIEFCALNGLTATAVKVVDIYASATTNQTDLVATIRANIFNTSAQQLLTSAPDWPHLLPETTAEPTQHFDLANASDDELTKLGTHGGRGLSLDQMKQIAQIQLKTGASTTSDVLLEALDARWSDHCAHTTWKQYGNLLKKLKTAARNTNNPNIVSMFDDNAGVWDFYNGQSLTIKAETHNGPTAIAAYFGQLTKLGGVLRDILGTGLGSDPIGSFEYTATGLVDSPSPIADRPAPRQIALDTVRAISEYGNTFGVPMMFSRMAFHHNYRAKPFALGGSIGVIPTDKAHKQQADPGDLVVLVGGLTGGEGLHGASASSAGAEMVESAVQIGTPLEEVKFRSAILDWRDNDCLSAITDLGAAGINSAAGEMGEACGVWVNTALVPLKTAALPVWKILLSESQERMLLAVPPAKYDAAARIAERHKVPFHVIGRFIDSGHYTVLHDETITVERTIDDAQAHTTAAPESVAFDVPYDLIDPPVTQMTVGPPPPVNGSTDWPELPAATEIFARVLGHNAVHSQIWADQQYDSTVRGITVHGPQYGTDTRVNTYYWAGQPVDDCDGVAIFTTDFTPALFEIDPVTALRQSFVRSLTTQVLAGSQLRDVCLTDNFYTPHKSEHAAEWLVAMVNELESLVNRFKTPVISGKDSSAGSVHTEEGMVHVPPAVFFSALGKAPSAAELLPETWSTPGNVIVQVGLPTPSFAGTVASDLLTDAVGGALDTVDVDAAEEFLAALREHRSAFVSATMVRAGGLGATLAHAALGSGRGVRVAAACESTQALLTENRCAALVELPADQVGQLPAALHPVVVGEITEAQGVWVAQTDILNSDALTQWADTFERSINGK